MFRIVSRRTAWWPVRFGGVTEEGKVVENEVELRFVILDEDEIVSFYDRLELAGVDDNGNVQSQAAIALPHMLEIVEDWRKIADEAGAPLPFTPDNFLQLLKVPNAAKAIGTAYRDCRNAAPAARAGN